MRPQAIYETAGDEEMVRFLETAGEAEETELLSDEKMDLLKKRQKELWNYIDGFSGNSLRLCLNGFPNGRSILLSMIFPGSQSDRNILTARGG